MSLRDDIGNALDSVFSSLPDATHTMRHGERIGNAVQASSRDFSEDIAADDPTVAARYIIKFSQFPELDQGAAVELDGSLRAVVTMKADPLGATCTVGLSAPFEKNPATYNGSRRKDGALRTFSHPIDVLAIENGNAANYSEAFAPTGSISYTVAIRRDDWPEVSEPETADTLSIAPNGGAIKLKVSTVTRNGGWYILKCRTRG